MGKREGESYWCFRAQESTGSTHSAHNGHLSTEDTVHIGRQHHPPLCGGPCGQDDLLNLSLVFWNIPIHGVVGLIFLESPNMGRIPQTLKLSHLA